MPVCKKQTAQREVTITIKVFALVNSDVSNDEIMVQAIDPTIVSQYTHKEEGVITGWETDEVITGWNNL
jgi:hypothetical protein